MTADEIVDFLKAIKAKKIKVKNNGWVEACCPLATWTHKNGQDSTPSFGIVIAPGERSSFACFGCRKGSVEELIQTIEMYAGADLKHYDMVLARALLDNELVVKPLPEYGTVDVEQQFQEWPAYWLDSFTSLWMSGEAMAYLASRQVDPAMSSHFGLVYDPTRSMVVFPYHDAFGRFAGARGRSIDPDAKFKHYDYTWSGVNNSKLVWYNEQVLDQKGPVVVVEGQFDAIRVTQGGHAKVVANLTALPIWSKFKKLSGCGTLIHIPDADEAGNNSKKDYYKLCQKAGLRYRVIDLDPGVKDPAEAHPAYLYDRIAEWL